jgi:hypothetical protein
MARICFAVVALCVSGLLEAHGGGLNADGCHTNRKTGDYHCHRAPSVSSPSRYTATPSYMAPTRSTPAAPAVAAQPAAGSSLVQPTTVPAAVAAGQVTAISLAETASRMFVGDMSTREYFPTGCRLAHQVRVGDALLFHTAEQAQRLGFSRTVRPGC